jgi:hypothetical protein
MNVCLVICLYVCLYFIQIHISEPIGTKLCTHLPLGLEETVGSVWARISWPLRLLAPFPLEATAESWAQDGCRRDCFCAIPLYPWFQLVFAWRHRHYVVADGGVIRGSFISVILAGVSLTLRKLRRFRRQSHPPQLCVPYSGGCYTSRHGYYVQPGGGAICHSVISLIQAHVFVAYKKSCPCRWQFHVPTPSVLQSR